MSTTKLCPQCGTPLPVNTPDAQCPKCLLNVGMGTQPEAAEGARPTKSDTPPPTPAELAPHFPQLEILELLGQGGMGIVYKARQPHLDRLVALKILPIDAAVGELVADRFRREARTLARLTHPNIVAIYDFGETNGIFYLVMEYVDGANLRELERSGQLGPVEALKIVPAICDALQYAHDQGIVHRDVKPENVLLDKQGRVKIADFGLAKILGRPAPELALTRVRQVMGTPNYMAPEQIEHPLEVDHRADIYSLGVVIYEMLTGELPIGHFELPSQRVEIDARLDQVVLRALARERERRYQHVSEVKSDVETIAASPAQVTPPAADIATRQCLQALQAVRGPAIGLVAIGILNWILVPLYAVVGVYFLAHQGNEVSGTAFTVALLALMVCSSFMIVAGLKLKALEAYHAAMLASILSILVSPGNLIGLPVGIWALVTLTRRGMKEAFRARPGIALGEIERWRGTSDQSAADKEGDKSRRTLYAIAGVFLAGILGLGVLAIGAVGLFTFLPALHVARERAQQLNLNAAVANAELIKAFAVSESTLSGDLVVTNDAWFLQCTNAQTVRLFEVTGLDLERLLLVYRAQLKTEDFNGQAYLEMWCRFPDGSEYFSRGLDNAVSGSNDWGSHQTVFVLRQGQRPDLVRLNLAVEGTGSIWLRDVGLLGAPLE
jgi:predicted Ser/Thr protein kinase